MLWHWGETPRFWLPDSFYSTVYNWLSHDFQHSLLEPDSWSQQKGTWYHWAPSGTRAKGCVSQLQAVRIEMFPWPPGWRCSGHAADAASSILPCLLSSTSTEDRGRRERGCLTLMALRPPFPSLLFCQPLCMVRGGTGPGHKPSFPYPYSLHKLLSWFLQTLVTWVLQTSLLHICLFFFLLFGKNFVDCWVVHREWEHAPPASNPVWARQALVAPSSSLKSDFINTVFQQRHSIVFPSGCKDADLQEKFLKVFIKANWLLCWEIVSLCTFVPLHFYHLWRFDFCAGKERNITLWDAWGL